MSPDRLGRPDRGNRAGWRPVRACGGCWRTTKPEALNAADAAIRNADAITAMDGGAVQTHVPGRDV